jgi:hypothetical protein
MANTISTTTRRVGFSPTTYPAEIKVEIITSNSRRHHGAVIGAQARSTARCKPTVEVRPGRGEIGTAPEKLGRLVRGAQSERPKKERQSGVVNM